MKRRRKSDISDDNACRFISAKRSDEVADMQVAENAVAVRLDWAAILPGRVIVLAKTDRAGDLGVYISQVETRVATHAAGADDGLQGEQQRQDIGGKSTS
jgi:hypothetical protein